MVFKDGEKLLFSHNLTCEVMSVPFSGETRLFGFLRHVHKRLHSPTTKPSIAPKF